MLNVYLCLCHRTCDEAEEQQKRTDFSKWLICKQVGVMVQLLKCIFSLCSLVDSWLFGLCAINWKHFNYLCCSLISHERHHSGWIRLTRPFHLFCFGTPLGVQSLGLFWIAGATFQAFLNPDITDIRTCFQGCEERSPVQTRRLKSIWGCAWKVILCMDQLWQSLVNKRAAERI